jgi:hypothetical protein
VILHTNNTLTNLKFFLSVGTFGLVVSARVPAHIKQEGYFDDDVVPTRGIFYLTARRMKPKPMQRTTPAEKVGHIAKVDKADCITRYGLHARDSSRGLHGEELPFNFWLLCGKARQCFRYAWE